MFYDNAQVILREIEAVLATVKEHEISELLKEIKLARKIVVCGAGRVGLCSKAFAMRLGHLGKTAYTLGDSTLPSIGEADLIIVASGSGETQTIFDIASIAKANGCRVAVITGNIDSRIGKLGSVKIEMKAPSKTSRVNGITSAQPMSTLNEQCLTIFFDAICLELMKALEETHETMWARHSNLE